MGYDNFSNSAVINKTDVNASNTHEILGKKMFIDGFGLVLDLINSHDLILVDEKTGDEYLDFFSFFASSPVGINHPKMLEKEFLEELSESAVNNPSNSDIYTVQMAKFVDKFSKIAVPDFFKHMFFISGGTLAVENALKTAFDWKVKKNFKKGYKEERGHKIIHFREAFHGRSGYTMSLTNTDPVKTALFPKFDWPRITNPKILFPISDNLQEIEKNEAIAVSEIMNAIKNNKDDIAAIIIEPIQGEGGDNFFRKEFFIRLREIADQNEILLIFDEVQTGIGMTGKMWAFEHYVKPDIISFGKKVQVCGILVNDRIDDIDDNVFKVSSRINSTWGGNLTDMVRSKKYFEIINEENLVDNAEQIGKYLLEKINEIQNEFPNLVSQARGLGLMCSFNLPNPEIRKQFLSNLYKNKMIMLGCGTNTVRFRPPLTTTKAHVDLGIKIIKETLHSL
jgi:L-lysine 6-transaminase